MFSRQFATMINSGLSLLRALTLLGEQTSNRRYPPGSLALAAMHLHIGERRADVTLALVLGLLQCVENEAHQDAPSALSAIRSGAPSVLVSVSSTI